MSLEKNRNTNCKLIKTPNSTIIENHINLHPWNSTLVDSYSIESPAFIEFYRDYYSIENIFYRGSMLANIECQMLS